MDEPLRPDLCSATGPLTCDILVDLLPDYLVLQLAHSLAVAVRSKLIRCSLARWDYANVSVCSVDADQKVNEPREASTTTADLQPSFLPALV